MPAARGKFLRLQVELTRPEWERISAEAYSREISRGELCRRAVAHFVKTAASVSGMRSWSREELTRRAISFFFECQDLALEEIVSPPKGWRMPRPTLTA